MNFKWKFNFKFLSPPKINNIVIFNLEKKKSLNLLKTVKFYFIKLTKKNI